MDLPTSLSAVKGNCHGRFPSHPNCYYKVSHSTSLSLSQLPPLKLKLSFQHSLGLPFLIFLGLLNSASQSTLHFQHKIMEVKKVVLKLSIHDDKGKQKAMKAVSCLPGIESIAVDLKESKMTVIGDVDPVQIVNKLRKQWSAQILTVGPKEEKKDGKKDDKKDEKKDDKKDEKKDDNKKSEKEQLEELVKAYKAYNPPIYYCVQSMEENPNACVIC